MKLQQPIIFGPKMMHWPPKKNFFRKIIKMIFMYLCTTYTVQIFKETLKWIQSYQHIIFGTKMAKLPWKIFFSKENTDTILMYLLASLTVLNFTTNPLSISRVTTVHNFWTQNGAFAQAEDFSRNIIKVIFMHLVAPFIVQN